MPNWCENDLTVEGPKETVEEFLRFAVGEIRPEEARADRFDFERFIPYPEEFRRMDEATEAWDKEHAGKQDADWRLRPKDGFNAGGYEWCISNWGTKWPAIQVEVEEMENDAEGKTSRVIYHFNTAWSPPTPVIAKAAELFSTLDFDLRYFECGFGFSGTFRCSGGKVVSDESGPYHGNRGG